MTGVDARPGQLVRIVGEIGTPSQKSAVWVLDDWWGLGIENAQMYRLENPDCIVRWKWRDIEPINPLKMLAEQAE